MSILTDNLLFGIVLSLITFEIGLYIYKKFKMPIFNPLLIAMILTIGFLLAFNIDFETYNEGAQFINMFLGPSTVVLAVPLYKQLDLLKENAVAILIGIFSGAVASVISVIGLCYLFKIDTSIMASLIPKSVTTPIGIEISNSLGGITSITVLSIVITGIIGAVIGPSILKMCKIRNNIALGVALGTASHAVGTTTALELGETQGAMSSLSIGVCGIMTVFIAPVIYSLSTYITSFFI